MKGGENIAKSLYSSKTIRNFASLNAQVMDRQQICKTIKELKTSNHITDTEIAYKTQSSEAQVRKMLSGSVNFFVESAIKICKVVGALIVVKNEREQIELNNRTTLTWWAQKSQRDSGLSVNKFKDEIGLTRVALTANLKGESKMRIDTLLKWADITGYMVEVWKK